VSVCNELTSTGIEKRTYEMGKGTAALKAPLVFQEVAVYDVDRQ
jgi:hypothetical protein